MEFSIGKCCNASKEKWQTISDWWNRIAKDKNAQRKGNQQLGISEANISKQVEMKEKIRKNISGEVESYSRLI